MSEKNGAIFNFLQEIISFTFLSIFKLMLILFYYFNNLHGS